MSDWEGPADIDDETASAATLAELRATEQVLGTAFRRSDLMHTLVACGLSGADLDNATHRLMWRVAVRLHERGREVDFRIVEQELIAEGVEPDTAAAFMAAAMRDALDVDTPDLAHRVEAMKQRVALRRIRELGESIVMSAAKRGASAQSITHAVRPELDRIERGAATVQGAHGAELEKLALARLDMPEGAPPSYVSIGVPCVDDVVGGVPRGGMMVIAAEHKTGKTTMVKRIALHALKHGKRVAIWSFEMKKWEITEGLAEQLAGVKIPTNPQDLDSRAQAAVRLAASALVDLPLWIEDPVDLTAEELSSQVYAYSRNHGIDLVIVENLQGIALSTTYRQDELNFAHISTTMRKCMKQTGVAAIFMSQIKEEARDDKGRRAHANPTDNAVPQTKAWVRDTYLMATMKRDKHSQDALVQKMTKFQVVANRINGVHQSNWLKWDGQTARIDVVDESGEPIGARQTRGDDCDGTEQDGAGW